jgi:hypothetical protein
MTLTHAMGIQYLWVDRLCIIQDESSHLTEQLSQMASIYANSYFSVIVVDGADANYGLSGIDPDASPRSNPEISFTFTRTAKMIEEPILELKKHPPFWNSCGWAFQERILSMRTLIFTQNTVYWQRRSATWYETVGAEPDGISFEELDLVVSGIPTGWPFYALKVKLWPDIREYFTFVGGFNDRNLTFESDALHAFTAIMTANSKIFPGGFHFGLPVFMFDMGMMWFGTSPLRRRDGFPS